MKCPNCTSENHVLKYQGIRKTSYCESRIRTCQNCHFDFTTVEFVIQINGNKFQWYDFSKKVLESIYYWWKNDIRNNDANWPKLKEIPKAEIDYSAIFKDNVEFFQHRRSRGVKNPHLLERKLKGKKQV